MLTSNEVIGTLVAWGAIIGVIVIASLVGAIVLDTVRYFMRKDDKK